LRSARGAGAEELSVAVVELSVEPVEDDEEDEDELSVVDGVVVVDEVSFGIVLVEVELSVEVAGLCAVDDELLLSVVCAKAAPMTATRAAADAVVTSVFWNERMLETPCGVDW
jgi:hypothetical protein